MNAIKTVAMLAVLASLSACATVDQPAASGTADAASADGHKLADSSTITGTRIPSKKSSQPVTATSGQDYDNATRNAATPLSKN